MVLKDRGYSASELYLLTLLSALARTNLGIYWKDANQTSGNPSNVTDQWPLLLTWFNFNPSMDK